MYYATLYSSQHAEAKQITNEVFYNFFKSVSSFNSNRPVKPWLKSITINTSINLYRKNQRKNHQIVELHTNNHHTIENIAVDHLGYEDLMEMINQLPPQYKIVFNLYAVEGFKHQEIAEKLEISIGTSKSNYYRAKQKLQEIIELRNVAENERRKFCK